MTKEARKYRTGISSAYILDCLDHPARFQFTNGSVTRNAYNDKEQDRMHSLNTYDYGELGDFSVRFFSSARQYNDIA